MPWRAKPALVSSGADAYAGPPIKQPNMMKRGIRFNVSTQGRGCWLLCPVGSPRHAHSHASLKQQAITGGRASMPSCIWCYEPQEESYHIL